jgi:hypothetical protein
MPRVRSRQGREPTIDPNATATVTSRLYTEVGECFGLAMLIEIADGVDVECQEESNTLWEE